MLAQTGRRQGLHAALIRHKSNFKKGARMQIAVWSALGLVSVVGLVALISPRCFAVIAATSGRWVDTDKVLAKLDRPIDIDRYFLPRSRMLGAAVIAAVAILGMLL